MKHYIIIFLLLFIGVVLYITVSKITEQDNLNSPTYIFHTSAYLEKCFTETGMKNITEAIMINYRSTDTIGGIIILLALIISISSLLRSSMRDIVETGPIFNDVILKTVTAIVTPLCLVFTFYIFYHGDIFPGGGFQAGLILGATLIMLGISFGNECIEKKILFRTRISIISIAFITIIFIGMIGPILGYNFFTFYFPDILDKLKAEKLAFFISKILAFNITLIVGIITGSLYYIMEGNDL